MEEHGIKENYSEKFDEIKTCVKHLSQNCAFEQQNIIVNANLKLLKNQLVKFDVEIRD